MSPIVGSDGNDLLHGTDDSDIIRALAEDDEIFGSAGENQIAGGDGIDTFTFESLNGAANRIIDLTFKTSGGDSHDIINHAKLLQENSQADFIELQERADQYVRAIRGDSDDYDIQVDFDGIQDDQAWQTIATATLKDHDQPEAVLYYVKTNDIMPVYSEITPDHSFLSV